MADVAPILITIFNRPELTRRLMESLSQVQPPILLIAADGPRWREEERVCLEARKCASMVDWPCEVRTTYADDNMGCGVRVHTAITWALQQHDRIIVLEDDCIPEPTFFSFCTTLLDFYRNDSRVMHIGGFNLQTVSPVVPESYYFSKYTIASGAWATWRRAWRCYDWKIKDWPALRAGGLLEWWCDDPFERRYWEKIFDSLHGGTKDVWDFQWNLACWAHHGLAILPSVPLATNIGYGKDATHTKEPVPSLVRPTSAICEIQHPYYILPNIAADSHTFNVNWGGEFMKLKPSAWVRAKRRLKRLLIR
jgi:hypothetical protein